MAKKKNNSNDFSTFVESPSETSSISIADIRAAQNSDEPIHEEVFEDINDEPALNENLSGASESTESDAHTDLNEKLENKLADVLEEKLSDEEAHEEELALDGSDLPPLHFEDDSLFEDKVSRLSKAMQAEEETRTQELVQLAAEEAVDSAELLAAQIAEDEAVNAELAKEMSEAEAEDAPSISAELDQAELESCLEAILFISDKPLSGKKLKELLNPEIADELFQAAVQSLMERYQVVAHGIELVEVAGGFQFRTKPGRSDAVKKLTKIQTQRLSSGAMESLAIIAYKQPVLKDDIDSIRGVDSSHFIRTLMDRKLIEISGRSELPGRPMVYVTTSHFMEVFGLKDLADLPPLREIEQMVPMSQTKNDEDDPRIIQMRKMMGQLRSNDADKISYDPHEDEKILQDIRERVGSIPTSTPYLEQQKEAEKHAKELAANPELAQAAALAMLQAHSPASPIENNSESENSNSSPVEHLHITTQNPEVEMSPENGT